LRPTLALAGERKSGHRPRSIRASIRASKGPLLPPSIAGTKELSWAPSVTHHAHRVLDAPEHCCGVCLSVLTNRGSTDAYPRTAKLYNPRITHPRGPSRFLRRHRGACAMRASELKPILWVSQQNERRKGRKGRESRILRKQGPFRGRREVAETRRKPAETPCISLPHPWVHFRALIGGSLAEIAETPARGPPDRYCEKLEGGRPPIGAAKQQEKAG
jgi:hypothetical protein